MSLTINNMVIEKLNGPVITFVAKPKNDNIPTFLIFGEKHTNITSSCESHQDNTEVQTAKVNDQFNEIFTQLNQMAETIDVHFYAEHFFDTDINAIIKDDTTTQETVLDDISEKMSNIEFEGLLKIVEETKRYCYYNELRKKTISIFKTACPFPNIKWQYSDIRNTIDDTYFHNIHNFDNILTDILGTLFSASSIGYDIAYNKDKDKHTGVIGPMDPSIDMEGQTIRYFTKMWRDQYLTIEQKYGKIIQKIDQSILLTDQQIRIKKLTDNEIIQFLQYYINFNKNEFDDIVDKTIQSRKINKQFTKFIHCKIKQNCTVNRVYHYVKLKIKSLKTGIKSNIKVLRYSRRKSEKVKKQKALSAFIENQIREYIKLLKDKIFAKNEIISNLYTPLFELIITFLSDGRKLTNFEHVMTYIESKKQDFTEDYKKIIKSEFYMYMGIFSFIVDIYFLLRSFKSSTKKGFDRKIVCSLLGYKHVLNLLSFFEINKDMYDIYIFDNMNGNYKQFLDSGKQIDDFNSQCVDMTKYYNNESVDPNSGPIMV